MESTNVFELAFEVNPGNTAACLDTHIWSSKIFNEKENKDESLKQQGELAEHIIQKYPKQGEFLILLDTNIWEFRSIVLKKFRKFGEIITNYLSSAKISISNGKNPNQVKSEYTRLLKENPDIWETIFLF